MLRVKHVICIILLFRPPPSSSLFHVCSWHSQQKDLDQVQVRREVRNIKSDKPKDQVTK